MNFMGNSYMDWEEKGKGFLSRPAFPGRAYARKGGEGDTFYLLLSTWRPWREVLGFFHAKVAKGILFISL
jgi:hypothetical protein